MNEIKMLAELCSHEEVLGKNLLPSPFRLLTESSSCGCSTNVSIFLLGAVGQGSLTTLEVAYNLQHMAPSVFKPPMVY